LPAEARQDLRRAAAAAHHRLREEGRGAQRREALTTGVREAGAPARELSTQYSVPSPATHELRRLQGFGGRGGPTTGSVPSAGALFTFTVSRFSNGSGVLVGT